MTQMGADPQVGMWEREIENADLEHACKVLWDAQNDSDLQAELKRINQAKQTRKDRLREVGLGAGERLRVGPFVITGVKREGGGFEIPEWESVTVSDVQRLDL